ncbi:Flp pilus assembly protein CpaB [Rhizobium sp.]|jgi:pilus assembly protein CpaB|uniref:Flp pilus assembly protein CpaB n=1 Tax=Rhizobium sp. TaxID=391 RepID=UPI000E981A46|nr:Flp pilus assembly protein CpaB [Rhizobium sp.]
MKPARIFILIVAVVAAGLAGLLAMSVSGPKNVIIQSSEKTVVKDPTVNVLVASSTMPVGARLSDKAMRWMAWPKTGLVAGFVTQDNRPNAIKDLEGSVVRLPIFEGEPIRLEKVADASGSTLSALLPAGKRAVATEISVATGAGGFILPNDRVDLIMVRKLKQEGKEDISVSQILLSNIRVLAIDQQIDETGKGGRSVIGTTATLELTPEQVTALAAAQQAASRLTLSLRSVADAQEPDTGTPQDLATGNSNNVLVIKSGEVTNGAGVVN